MKIFLIFWWFHSSNAGLTLRKIRGAKTAPVEVELPKVYVHEVPGLSTDIESQTPTCMVHNMNGKFDGDGVYGLWLGDEKQTLTGTASEFGSTSMRSPYSNGDTKEFLADDYSQYFKLAKLVSERSKNYFILQLAHYILQILVEDRQDRGCVRRTGEFAVGLIPDVVTSNLNSLWMSLKRDQGFEVEVPRRALQALVDDSLTVRERCWALGLLESVSGFGSKNQPQLIIHNLKSKSKISRGELELSLLRGSFPSETPQILP